MLDSFVDVGLLKNEIDMKANEISASNKLTDKSASTVANIYKSLFDKRTSKFPDHIKSDLDLLLEGKEVEKNNEYISKEFATLLVNVFKCIDAQKTSKDTNCHVKTWRGFLKVSQLLWFVSKPSQPITSDNIHFALAFSMQRYIQGLIKLINKMSGSVEPSSHELKEVRKVPWEKVFAFADKVKCDVCEDEYVYYCGNSMFENIDNFLQVLWNYKISHPFQFGLIPTLGGSQIESMVGTMISDKAANIKKQIEDEL